MEVVTKSMLALPNPNPRPFDEWFNTSNIQIKKIKESQWGSYQILVSFDGQQYIQFPRRFGWGFSEKEAFEIEMQDAFKDVNKQRALLQFIGVEKFTKLKQAMNV